MASSVDKAIALKDSYVKGIISDLGGAGEEQTLEGTGRNTPSPELAGKLGMEQGQQASVHYNVDENRTIGINDGEPLVTIRKDGQTKAYDRISGRDLEGVMTGAFDRYDAPRPAAGQRTSDNRPARSRKMDETDYLNSSRMHDRGMGGVKVPEGFGMRNTSFVAPNGKKFGVFPGQYEFFGR